MFRLDVWQNQWVIVALLGGAALMLMVLLLHLALSLPRGEAAASLGRRGMRAFLPWVLVVLYVSAAAYAVVYLIFAAGSPPNW